MNKNCTSHANIHCNKHGHASLDCNTNTILQLTWLPSPESINIKSLKGCDTNGVRHSSGVPLQNDKKQKPSDKAVGVSQLVSGHTQEAVKMATHQFIQQKYTAFIVCIFADSTKITTYLPVSENLQI